MRAASYGYRPSLMISGQAEDGCGYSSSLACNARDRSDGSGPRPRRRTRRQACAGCTPSLKSADSASSLPGVARRRERAVPIGAVFLGERVQGLDQELLLAVEVEVDDPTRKPGGLGDVGQGGRNSPCGPGYRWSPRSIAGGELLSRPCAALARHRWTLVAFMRSTSGAPTHFE